jgi:hypothetical protein
MTAVEFEHWLKYWLTYPGQLGDLPPRQVEADWWEYPEEVRERILHLRDRIWSI